jgi:hypothetical protein
LRWPFAIIYSLPRDYLIMLESPMPFFAGLQMPEGEFLEDVYPKMKNSQKNRLLLIFLDSNSISPYEFEPHDLSLPHFDGVWGSFLRDYSKYHGVKKSKYFDLEKKKSPLSKKEVYCLKMKAKPDKKAKKQKTKPKATPLEVQLSSPGSPRVRERVQRHARQARNQQDPRKNGHSQEKPELQLPQGSPQSRSSTSKRCGKCS